MRGSRLSVAAIFYAVYYTLCICVPTWTPSVHLRVQSLACHILLVFVTEAVCSIHTPRTTRLRCIKRMDNVKPYTRVTYLKARLSLVNWYAIWMFRVCNAICFSVEYRCFVCAIQYAMVYNMNVLLVQCNLLLHENEC